MFNSGNVNLTPKFHGENFKMDGLLNRLGMEALKGHWYHCFFYTDLKLLLFFFKLGLGHFGGDHTRHKPRP